MKDERTKPKTSKGKSKRKPRTNYKPREDQSKVNDKLSSGKFDHNDPNWYIYDRTMFDGVISMPTLDFKGIDAKWPTPSGDYETAMGTDPNPFIKAPTVVGYYMNPAASVDINNSETSAINIASRTLFADLSSNNAKTTQYTPEDVSMLTLALGQIIAMAHFLKRAYGITNYFNFYNRKVPNSMMAMHCMSSTGIDNWIKDMPEFRARLNKVIAQINTIEFPENLDYFNKCKYIYNNVFVDRDDKMPTYQMMIPHSTWIVDEASYDQGTILETMLVCDGSTNPYNSPIDLVLILEAMVQRVLTSATYNLIYSDVLNAAKKNMIHGTFIHVDLAEPGYVVEPLYSEQFNWQVMNMNILGAPNGTSATADSTPSNSVYPDINALAIKYQPVWAFNEGTASLLKNQLAIRKPLPVRIPNVDISNDEFVELLAYYNYPHVTSINDAKANIRYDGLSDYYCVRVGVTKGGSTEVITTVRQFYPDGVVSTFDLIPFILNVVHAPIFGFYVSSSNKVFIASKLGAYMFPDGRSIRNLRYETYLGLFSFKTK